MSGGPSAVPTLDGEYLAVSERLIVAPTPGRFVAHVGPGDVVAVGQTVGRLERSDGTTAVRCEFAGRLMGHLADDGERVRPGQPLAWIRPAC